SRRPANPAPPPRGSAPRRPGRRGSRPPHRRAGRTPPGPGRSCGPGRPRRPGPVRAAPGSRPRCGAADPRPAPPRRSSPLAARRGPGRGARRAPGRAPPRPAHVARLPGRYRRRSARPAACHRRSPRSRRCGRGGRVRSRRSCLRSYAAIREDAVMTIPAPIARFDDVAAGRSLQFSRAERVIRADRPEEVRPALAAVQEAVESGSCAFGMLAYEAAAGLDPDARVRAPQEGLPLVWFGIADAPDEDPPPLTTGEGYELGP